MKHLNIIVFYLCVSLVISFWGDIETTKYELTRAEQAQYSKAFKQAVQDSGTFLAQFDAQQVTGPIRYSSEKNIASDLEVLHDFYEDLVLKFGVTGDPYALQDIMLHIPASVMVRYNGFNMITLEQITEGGQQVFKPVVWPLKPFTYKLPNGLVLFFRLDDTLTLYDPGTNQYLEGTYETLRVVRDLSPLTSVELFKERRKKVIAESIEKDLAGAINTHIQVTKNIDLAVDFFLPQDVGDTSIENIGFMSFMQGYPLPGGEMLNTFAFGTSRVQQGKILYGVIRTDGRHVAYFNYSDIPAGSALIETLVDEEEAARKGYYIDYKD